MPPSTSRESVVSDVLASFVVLLVAVPLCIGIAVACNVPPERGLITGVIGGIVVGLFAGSPLLVSGPAASLIVLVFEIVQTRGLAALAPVVMLAGVWQIIAGKLKLGQWFRAVAPAVVHGMLLGIGVLIVGSQLHIAIDSKPAKTFITNIASFPGELWQALSTGNIADAAPFLTGVSTAVILLGWNYLRPKRLALVPGHLVSVVAVVVGVAVLDAPVRFLDVSPKFFSGLDVASGSTLKLIDASVIGSSLIFAFVASAATLLTAVAIDQRQSFVKTDYNREMIAQGIGNLSVGALGGLPMTGVIVRSSVNVDAGARTRLSTILHGVWILAFVVAFPQVLAMIPRSCLGAILVITGVKLFDHRILRVLYQRGRAELAICLVTLCGVVFIDLFTGIMLGLGTALFKIVYTFSHVELTSNVTEEGEHTFELGGSATFLRLPALAEALERVPEDKVLHLKIDRLEHIDHACLELLANWDQQRKAQGHESLVVDWGVLGSRYHRTFWGPSTKTHGRKYSSGAVGSMLLSEWRRIYKPVEDPESTRLLTNDWITADRISLGIEAREANEVYLAAAEVLSPAVGMDIDVLIKLLIERSAHGGFSIGDGVAIPHIPVPNLERSLVAFVTTKEPIDMGGEPTDVFFVLVTPDGDPRIHLLSLAHIARTCHDKAVLAELRATNEVEAVRALLTEAEEDESPHEIDAKVMVALDFGDEKAALHAVEVIGEALTPPALLTVDDGAAFEAVRALLHLPASRRLVLVSVETRDVHVLMTLAGEIEKQWKESTSMGLSFLRVDNSGASASSNRIPSQGT